MAQGSLFDDVPGGDVEAEEAEEAELARPPAARPPAGGRAPVTVYTDGACSGNPGPGGWAWAVAPDGTPSGAGGEARTTNQRMEIKAVVEALRSLGPGRTLHVVSDSTYVVNCFRDRWYAKWERNGWVNAQKKPVANADLWRELLEQYRANEVTFGWVKGHSGDRLNDIVDQLAVAAVPR